MPAPFIHLHTHSHYSLLYGACRIPDLLDACEEMEMDALAITDRGNLFGAVEFYEQAMAKGIRPILGTEVLLRRDPAPERQKGWDELRFRLHLHDSVVLLARDDHGYGQLMKLTSRGYLGDHEYRPEVTWEDLEEFSEGTIAISGGLFGPVARALQTDDFAGARKAAERLRNIYGDDCYLELVDHGLPDHKQWVRRTADLGRELGIELVASNHVHYLREEHAEAHDALLCIGTAGQKMDERRFRFETREMYFKSPDQMRDLFEDYPDAVENTRKIADRCHVEMEFGKLKLPPFPVPPEFEDLDAYLAHVCYEGLKERYDEITPEITERLDFELGIIRQMGYSGYFLIVMDFIRYARSINVPVGPGRGSAAGSLVAYSTGITNIDPLQYQLLFERFLNPERVSMPDIDVDFSDRGRGSVIQYVVEKYGAETVCQIITFGTMAARAAVRDVGRVMGMSPQDIDRLAKMVPEEIGIKLSKALEQSPDLKARFDSDPQVRELIDTALVLEGLSRHASTHAAGVIITPSALTEYVPLHCAGPDEITTQFDMVACEKIGLLKMDFLGLRTLTVLEDCLAMLSERGIEIDLDELPLTDEATFQLFSEGGTVGVFQFESSGMVEYLRKLKPEVLDDLIAMNALYRPGPLGSGMVDDFILRKQGEKKITYEHDVLEPILKDTYGVIVYQEQVMQIASAMAGYSLGEADLLRRAMGKKKKSVMDEQRASFVAGSTENGIASKTATSVFDLMAHFAGYGFNKSHSAGYALVAYQTGYLKAHYPVEFMAAALTSEMSKPERLLILLAEARRMKIEVLPPSINESQEGFRAAGEKIRFGLGAVKGVGRSAVLALTENREENGPFQDLYDLAERADGGAVNKKCFEALIWAGALDELGISRSVLADSLAQVLEWASRRRREREMGQASLFGGGSSAEAPRPRLAEVPDWDPLERLDKEKLALGFYVTGHPVDEYRTVGEGLGSLTCAECLSKENGTEVKILGLPVGLKISQDRKGRTMAFFGLEDASGLVEALCFEEPLERARVALEHGGPVIVKGKYSKRKEQSPKLILEEASALARQMELGRLSLHLGVRTDQDPSHWKAIRELLQAHPGECPVFLHVNHRDLDGVIAQTRTIRVMPGRDLVTKLKALCGERLVRVTAEKKGGFRSLDVFGHEPRRPAPTSKATEPTSANGSASTPQPGPTTEGGGGAAASASAEAAVPPSETARVQAG